MERALGVESTVPAERGTIAAPRAEEVTAELLTLAAETSAEMRPSQLAAAYHRSLTRLFPERRFSISLAPALSPRGAKYSQAETPDPTDENPLSLSRGALARHQRRAEDLELGSVVLTPKFVPRFSPDGAGMDVPLFDGKRITGVLAMEYAPGISPPGADAAILIPFALQLAGLLRCARLLTESTYYREYLEKLLEHANSPIVVIGRHRDLRGTNRAFSDLIGASPEELEGRDLFDLVPQEERTRLLPVLLDALRGEPTTNFELRLSTRAGSTVKLTFNAASILTPTGEVEAVIAIGSNRDEVQELQQMVIQSEKLATLGQLAASVVHELNNPLTSISVYGDYLLRHLRSSGAEASDVEKARRIVDASDRILSFTKDLMNYARPADADPAAVNLRQIIDDSLVFCEHLFDGERLVVDRAYAREQPRILGVVGQLQQVFINLFTNASQAMAETGGTLRVSTRPAADGWVVVEVSDTGKGIAADRLDQVFDPFFTTKEADAGTGLGLSVVRSIIDNHRGQIRVESKLGRGALFVLSFPTL